VRGEDGQEDGYIFTILLCTYYLLPGGWAWQGIGSGRVERNERIERERGVEGEEYNET
jgi:hypothetical protein